MTLIEMNRYAKAKILFDHAQRTVVLPHRQDVACLEYFLFLAEVPDQVTPKQEALAVANEILRMEPKNQIAKDFLKESGLSTSTHTSTLLHTFRTFGFVGTDELPYHLIHHMNRRKVEFMMRTYVDGKNVSYEFQLQSFTDDREDAD
ncbi:hypothetical protein [Exiguobacterium antarcticum]|nr:hypothetical protein [Exiguobacterium antarcticum]